MGHTVGPSVPVALDDGESEASSDELMRLLGEWRAAHDDEPHAAAEQRANLVEYNPDGRNQENVDLVPR